MVLSQHLTGSPTEAIVHLHKYHENVKKVKKHLHQTWLMAVVKTNAYGHGVVQISKEAVKAGADRLGVSSVAEGVLLRKEGIRIPIQILGAIPGTLADDAVAYDLIGSISTKEQALAFSKAAVRHRKWGHVHLKIDTGLHRFGVPPEEAHDFLEECRGLPNLYWEGVYTHFSHADDGDWQRTESQYEKFLQTIQALEEKGWAFPVRHAGGSTIMLERQDMYLDMVRPGISLFGYPPAARQRSILDLEPVMEVKTRILQLHDLSAQTSIGYGGSYTCPSRRKIAVVPVGHGDGYARSLSNRGQMIVRGQRAGIVGTISLDQTFLDVTDISGVCEGDEVILIGRQHEEQITAYEVAEWMDSITDEALASLKERIPRVYSDMDTGKENWK
ncbi:alanine racemase [Virgibacillus xinjiangensis]|uniref:Alanine racemase n=1 Tax=Virgibacillus xinjiangensis TaxID=393090 RepID=A0ABV7CT28_9BACI